MFRNFMRIDGVTEVSAVRTAGRLAPFMRLAVRRNKNLSARVCSVDRIKLGL